MTARFFHGDCLEVMKDLSANSIDCFICDLPYGCLATPRASNGPGWRKEVEEGKQKTLYREDKDACAWDIPIDLAEFWTQVKRLAKDEHTPVVMFCTTKFGNDLINSNPKWFRYDLVWDKGRGVSFLSANKMPMRSHEMIYVFSKAGAYYERVDISGEFQSYSFKATEDTRAGDWGAKSRTATQNDGTTRCVKSVIQTPNKTLRKSAHPTEKPIALYEWLIRRYCPAGGTVLDPTAGSFNSVQAAINLGRHAIGIEKDDKFFEKAEKRFQQETNEIVE